MLCAYCGEEKSAPDFTPQSKRKCRACLAAWRRDHYQKHGKRELAAKRRVNHEKRLAARAAQQPQKSVAERAYTAGIIDGEGCVSIFRRGSHGGTTFRQGQYVSLVCVNSTTKSMIDWLAERWGGTVYYVGPKPEKNRKEQWRWQLQSNIALRMLDEILEFMVVKHRHAQLVRRFQRYVQVSGRKRTDKVDRVQRRFWIELRRINHRGVQPFVIPPPLLAAS